jgi:hypothetical protein
VLGQLVERDDDRGEDEPDFGVGLGLHLNGSKKNFSRSVVPAKAGTQCLRNTKALDPRFRGDDDLLLPLPRSGAIKTNVDLRPALQR